jgi:single-strand DNA-binding protein
MPNHASATIIGHLGKKPELRTTQSGAKLLNATMAVNTGYGDNKRTTWWNVTVFGKQAETLDGFNLDKGDVIGFTGEVSVREYESNGSKRQSLELSVRDFILLGEKKDAKPSASATPAKISSEPPFNDDIPF